MFTSRKIGIYSSVCLKIVVILKSQQFILVKFKESHHGSIYGPRYETSMNTQKFQKLWICFPVSLVR